jgi:outer membrane lipoprotein carrier protein
MKHLLVTATLCLAAATAWADAVDTLRSFVTEVRSGRTAFTQTVTPADGTRPKVTSGTFEFQRPDRFRFDYLKPYVQTIVADGRQLWMYDPDLNQVTVRAFDQALGATPAALLAGDSLARDFVLLADPASEGLQWARATPKAADSGFKWMRVGFRGSSLAAVEILDRFDQRTRLQIESLEANVALPADRFSFVPPPGADVLQQ